MGPCSPNTPTPPHPYPSPPLRGGRETRRRHDLSVMAGLPAIHADTTVKLNTPLRALSLTVVGRVDARLEGGHDGWGQLAESPHPPPLTPPRHCVGEGDPANGMNLSVMAGLDPAIHADTTVKQNTPLRLSHHRLWSRGCPPRGRA